MTKSTDFMKTLWISRKPGFLRTPRFSENLDFLMRFLKILVFRVTPEEGITPETVERIA